MRGFPFLIVGEYKLHGILEYWLFCNRDGVQLQISAMRRQCNAFCLPFSGTVFLNQCYRSATKSSTFKPNFSFGINDDNTEKLANLPFVNFGNDQPRIQPVYNNCIFNINTPPTINTPMEATSSCRRIIIESDSDYSQEWKYG